MNYLKAWVSMIFMFIGTIAVLPALFVMAAGWESRRKDPDRIAIIVSWLGAMNGLAIWWLIYKVFFE